jgi:hypothetical protein
MGDVPGEGVTLDGSTGAVGEELPPPQATYPKASTSRNTNARSFFISDLLFGHSDPRRDALPA